MITDIAKELSLDIHSKEFAMQMDASDPLHSVRDSFLIPPVPGKANEQMIYLCGNSLGLQPKGLRKYMEDFLSKWADQGVGKWIHYTNDLIQKHHHLLKNYRRGSF